MDTAGGMDWQAKRLDGKVFTVRFIDNAGMIHLVETGLALIIYPRDARLYLGKDL